MCQLLIFYAKHSIENKEFSLIPKDLNTISENY